MLLLSGIPHGACFGTLALSALLAGGCDRPGQRPAAAERSTQVARSPETIAAQERRPAATTTMRGDQLRMTSDDTTDDILHATVGEVKVSLPESPTTGYRWTLISRPHQVLPVDETFLRAPSTEPIAGASGHRIFLFRVDTPGEYTLQFELKRAWEQQSISSRTIRLVVGPSP
jgi:inhibitor of cysteine peptidase